MSLSRHNSRPRPCEGSGRVNSPDLYITFESLNLHPEKFTLEKFVPQGLLRNTDQLVLFFLYLLAPSIMNIMPGSTPATNEA